MTDSQGNSLDAESTSPDKPFFHRHRTARKVALWVLLYAALFCKVSHPDQYHSYSYSPETQGTFVGLWIFGFVNLNGEDSMCNLSSGCDFGYTGYGWQWAANRFYAERAIREGKAQ